MRANVVGLLLWNQTIFSVYRRLVPLVDACGLAKSAFSASKDSIMFQLRVVARQRYNSPSHRAGRMGRHVKMPYS